jgi:ribosomal protein L30
MTSGKKVVVRQVKSSNGYDKRTKAVLQTLGLGRLGNQSELTKDAAVAGKLKRVAHLIQVCE